MSATTKTTILDKFPSLREIEEMKDVTRVVYLKRSVKVFIGQVTHFRHNQLLCKIGLDYSFAKYRINYGYILFTMS